MFTSSHTQITAMPLTSYVLVFIQSKCLDLALFLPLFSIYIMVSTINVILFGDSRCSSSTIFLKFLPQVNPIFVYTRSDLNGLRYNCTNHYYYYRERNTRRWLRSVRDNGLQQIIFCCERWYRGNCAEKAPKWAQIQSVGIVEFELKKH